MFPVLCRASIQLGGLDGERWYISVLVRLAPKIYIIFGDGFQQFSVLGRWHNPSHVKTRPTGPISSPQFRVPRLICRNNIPYYLEPTVELERSSVHFLFSNFNRLNNRINAFIHLRHRQLNSPRKISPQLDVWGQQRPDKICRLCLLGACSPLSLLHFLFYKIIFWCIYLRTRYKTKRSDRENFKWR